MFVSRSNTAQSDSLPSSTSQMPFIQAKLSVGKPGDKYEVEADKAADQIVSNDQKVSTPFFTPTPKVQKRTDEEVPKQEIENQVQQKPVVDPITSGVQLKPLIQKQVEEEIQTKEDEEIQEKCAECEKEDKVQTKSSRGQNNLGSIESSLRSSKGGGSPMPDKTRSSMESGFGADFSNVRIHTDSNAIQMNKSIGAQAFTNGSDIYFNQGKYNPESTSGKHLLAHELTHTIQQGGSSGAAQSKIQMVPDWVNSAANWVGDAASGVAEGISDGAAWVGDQVSSGAEWVGDQVSAGAEWVGDQISAAASWVMDGVRGAISSGTDFLHEKWERVQEFGTSSFEDIKNGFGSLASFISSPMTNMMSAMSDLNADLLEGAWNTLKSGGNALWAGINSLVDGVLQSGEAIWSSVTGFVNGIFDTISGFFNNSAFNLLPDSIKNGIQSAFRGLQSLWNRVSSFWDDLWTRLTSFAQEMIDAALNFIENVINYGISQVISLVRNLKEAYDYVTAIFADPMATITPYLQIIADKITTEGPPESEKIAKQMGQERSSSQDSGTNNGTIQRDMIAGEERDQGGYLEFLIGIAYYLKQAWNRLDFLEMLKQTFLNTFWPPATLKAILGELDSLWNDEWKETYNAMYTPRNFFQHPLGCMDDIWTNYLLLLDFPNALHRKLNNIIGLLMGYITIIVVLGFAISGATGGAVAGGAPALPGFFIGASAGMAIMSTAGAILSLSVVIAESKAVELNLDRFFEAYQTCEKRQIDLMTSVSSFITMAVSIVLALLMFLLSSLLSRISEILKAPFKSRPVAPPVKQPGLPPPMEPIPQPIRAPVREPIRIPIRRPPPQQPVPGRPHLQPGEPSLPIAAKFEDGIDGNLVAQMASEEQEENTVQTKEQQKSFSEADSQVANSAVVQMARRDDINPDACGREEDEDETDKTKVYFGNHNDGNKPGFVEALPLTHLPGDGDHEKGSPPKDYPAGWDLVKMYKYFEVYIDLSKPEGSGRQVRIKNSADRDFAKSKGYPIIRTTDWIRFHILNENLHGAGLFFNLLSSSGTDNNSYRSQTETKLKERVLSDKHTFHFRADASYRQSGEMANVHDLYGNKVKEIEELYVNIPKQLNVSAYRLKKLDDGSFVPHDAPNSILFNNYKFDFKVDLDVSQEPGSQEVVIMNSGTNTHKPLGIHNRLTVLLKSLRGSVNNVSDLVDAMFMGDNAMKIETGLEYLRIIKNALEQSSDENVIRLFDGGVTALEIEQLESKIVDLGFVGAKYSGDKIYQPYMESGNSNSQTGVKTFLRGRPKHIDVTVEGIKFRIKRPSWETTWNALKATGRVHLEPLRNYYILHALGQV